MDLDLTAKSPVGSLVTITGMDARRGVEFEHKAFLPHPLPDRLDLEPATYSALIDATAAVARLDQAAFRLPNPQLLARPAIRQEAVSTSALEGTYAAFIDVLEAELLDDGGESAAVQEVRNYIRAADAAYGWISDLPITVGMLCNLQSLLVKGTRSETGDAGRIRTIQVCIGGGGNRLEDARFVPPPPGLPLQASMQEWADWIEGDSSIPLIAKLALGHYQFESLHPFNDGNGRLGRLTCVLQLMRAGALRVPVLNLSPWLERRRRDYQDHLLQCSVTGRFDDWIRFFSTCVADQSARAVEKIDGLLDWKAAALRNLTDQRVKGVATTITEELIGFPVITPSIAAKAYGVTYPAANTAIKRLAELGILEERTGRRYGRLFAAPGVLQIIES
ncbi:Fic family protein [Nonomuraea sp. NPDC059007]|uniref:Fic family protein n=1 Tax=Nonomuraea sp. NPDC059007 TaxID=3346692 RepID=UPI0036CC1DD5